MEGWLPCQVGALPSLLPFLHFLSVFWHQKKQRKSKALKGFPQCWLWMILMAPPSWSWAGPANLKPQGREKTREGIRYKVKPPPQKTTLSFDESKTWFCSVLLCAERWMFLNSVWQLKLCGSRCFRRSRGERLCWSKSVERCAAVSGWFGLCSVGGQAPLQIKDFSVKVPDSSYSNVCDWVRLCASGRRGRDQALPIPPFFFSFL